MGRLTQDEVNRKTDRGVYPDGDGLYLQVNGADAKSWIFRYSKAGKNRWHGLGSARDVTLARARQKRDKARVQVRDGSDLVADKQNARTQKKLHDARAMTFREAAASFIESRKKEWGNAKHRAQWGSTLETYVYPKIGNTPLQEIDTDQVLEVLTPIWSEKPETARRVRGRMEKVFAWATFRKYRTGENPARWTGHLEEAELSKRPAVKHQPSLPYALLPEMMTKLRARTGSGSRALEFTILTAMRTTAVLGAKWDEVDFINATWTVPKERMKGKLDAKKPHVVPLSDGALAVLRSLPREGTDIFPGTDGRLSNMTMLAALRRLGDYRDPTDDRAVVVHGFRTTFRNWAAEKRPDVPGVVAEMALAHAVGDEVVQAHLRSDLLALRRDLMDAWGAFAYPPVVDNVLPLRSGAA